MNNYNKKHYLELLKKKSIGIRSEENSLKLSKYSCMLEGHLNWESRQNYLDLLEGFTKGKIKTLEFCMDFETRGKLIGEVTEMLESNLILLSPHEKSFGFSILLEEIFDLCVTGLQYDFCPSGIELQNIEIELQNIEIEFKNFEIEFKNYIEKTYFQIQKYLDE